MHITQQEVRKLAKLSQLEVTDHELETLMDDINSVLSYVSRLQQAASSGADTLSVTLEPVVRTDQRHTCDPEPILAAAPVRDDALFVVPVILKGE